MREGQYSIILEFRAYVDQKSRIQFQYPEDWILEVVHNHRTIYTSILSSDESSGILVCYGDHLMSTFGSSVFHIAMSESFNRHVGYHKIKKDVKILAKPLPVNIGKQAGGCFLYKLGKNKEFHEPRIFQVWLVYPGVDQYEIGGIGERGYEITFSSTHFYVPEISEIRDRLISTLEFF